MKYHMNSMILKMSMTLHVSYIYCCGLIAILNSLAEDDMLSDLEPDLLWYMLGEELPCGYNAIIDSYNQLFVGSKKKRKRTVTISQSIPTLDDVKAYCAERKNKVDPEQWYDFYSSKGWKIGKDTMKDWKAAVRTWERNTGKPTGSTKEYTNPALNYEQRKWTDADNESFFVDLSKFDLGDDCK